MHVHKRAFRSLAAAAALVTVALPLASPISALAQVRTGVTPTTASGAGLPGFGTNLPATIPTGCTPTAAPAANGVGAFQNAGASSCYVSATPNSGPAIFNPIGVEHTVTFTCDAGLFAGGFTGGSGFSGTETSGPMEPGCYDVTATVKDLFTGGNAPIDQATCGSVPADVSSGSVNCSGVASPICPVSEVPSPNPGPTTPCSPAPACPTGFSASGTTTFGTGACTGTIAPTDIASTSGVGGPYNFATSADCTAASGTVTVAPASSTVSGGGVGTCTYYPGSSEANTVRVTINPGANHAYEITFTGYFPTTAAGSCPAGTTLVSRALTVSYGSPPISTVEPTGAACRFVVKADKKYVEITNIKLTATPTNCGGNLVYSEGLKSYFGPVCAVTAAVTGTVVLKQVADCSTEPPAVPATLPSDFPAGATYVCNNGVLAVTNVPVPNANVVYTTTGGVGSFNIINTLGTLCAGTVGNPSLTAAAGTTVTFCATGPGSGTIEACLAPSTPNNQPGICSNTASFAFTVTIPRAVPYVRWAGEKVALTKCFGPGLGGQPVEFVLNSPSSTLGAALLPTDLASTIGGGTNPGSVTAGSLPSQNTIWTATDINGCATVIGYATGEGVMNVDAAIFNNTGVGINYGSPLVNEHAFEVFYLKFDHLDLENIQFQTYQTATALQPYTKFLSSTPPFNGATVLPTTFQLPGPPGTGEVAGAAYAVPLCQTQYVRAMVHGYLEVAGDPSGRPAANVPIPGAPAGSAGSYVLPAGRWVLPEDWPLLATFAGFNLPGQPGDFTPSSVLQWDLNSGYAFNPTGETPVLCNGTGSLTPYTGEFVNTIPASDVDLGPCFSQTVTSNGTTQVYSTAGPGYKNLCGALSGQTAETVGIGPFDALQSCTDPFPLPYTPSGASLVGGIPGLFSCPANAPAGPCLIPAGLNSTYLPNGTLNQWDAPMPPAQISFGITGGPGVLGQVNKTGLYALILDQGKPSATGCPTGYTVDPAQNGDCVLSFNPDPFYAEAIPASPFIPPVTNNGGYLWNSWNFSPGTVTAVRSAAAFTSSSVTPLNNTTLQPAGSRAPGNPPAGGFVPGQSTTVSIPAAYIGPVGLNPATCATGTPQQYIAIDPSNASNCLVSGGITIGGTVNNGNGTYSFSSGFFGTGPGCANPNANTFTNTTSSVVVADGRGFLPGMTVEIYDTVTGDTIVGAGRPSADPNNPGVELTIQSVIPQTNSGYPNAVELVFDPAQVAQVFGTLGCFDPYSIVIIAEQFGLPVSSAAPFTAGGEITFGNFASISGQTTLPVSMIDATNNIVYVDYTDNVAALGGCTTGTFTTSGTASGLSRPDGPTADPYCEPYLLVPAGTLIEAGPKGACTVGYVANGTACGISTELGAGSSAAPANPYPFWQFVGNNLPASSSTSGPQAGTVYSDNHGEAVVSLIQPVTTTLAPTNGTCPTGYNAFTINATVVSCELNVATLGSLTTPYGNIATALKQFTAGTPGCIQTYPTGTYAAVPSAVIGANGPAIGQVCVNSLGGLEFGASATLGQTTVQAVADYPYTRGDHPPIASAPLTKVFQSGFAKTVTVSAGAPGPAGTTAYTVTITATDVCGNPLYGEPVQVYALGNAGAAVLAPVSDGFTYQANTTSAVVSVAPDTGTATLSLEVLNTAIGTQGLVVKAVFPLEKIERFATVIAGSTPGATASVVYAPGWQQVGGPTGSNFSVAEALYSWNATSQAYSNATASAGNLSSAAPACTGYWAYFAAAMTVSLPATSQSGATVSCTLPAGWNLIGNSFATPATIGAGVTAYHWNGTSYDTVGTIPVGGSVWIFNDGTHNTVTLTAT